MKFGALKSDIRNLDGAPKALFRVGSITLEVHIQKTPLLAELDAKFPDGRATETGLCINHEGYLTRETD